MLPICYTAVLCPQIHSVMRKGIIDVSFFDWVVITVYLFAMFFLAAWLGRRQRSGADYFLAGRGMPSSSLAASTIATQCSTNSLLGAPAFVGFTVGGGMVWLQYELAVLLAMAALIFLIVPARQMGVISIYEILEQRLGRESRVLASGCFFAFSCGSDRSHHIRGDADPGSVARC